jgi:uncharacterized membrane protein
MTGPMTELWLAAAVFLATHFGISSTGLRGLLIDWIGEGPYTVAYSTIALAAITWLVMAYNGAPPGPMLWWLGDLGAYVAIVALPVALLLLVGGVSQPNPTAVGGDRLLDNTRPARGALRITRHPVMWGIGLWALSHLLSNGELRGVVFFGSLAILALVGTLTIDHKHRRRSGEAFDRFAEATSNLPLAAILARRQSFGKAVTEMGWIRLGAAAALYAVLLHLHRWAFGASPYPL